MVDPGSPSPILGANLSPLPTHKNQHNNRETSLQFTAPSPEEAEDWVDQIQFLLKGESSSLGQASMPCSFGQILAASSHPAWAAPSSKAWACAYC